MDPVQNPPVQPQQATIPSPDQANAPLSTLNTQNAADNVLSQNSPNSSGSITDNHEVSWLQGFSQGAHAFFTHPLVKTIISLSLIFGCAIAFVVTTSLFPAPLTFGIVAFSLTFGIITGGGLLLSVLVADEPKDHLPELKKPAEELKPQINDREALSKLTEERKKIQEEERQRLEAKDKEIAEIQRRVEAEAPEEDYSWLL